MGKPQNHWERIGEVYRLCQELAVSFSLHYNENNNTWHYSIDSIAENECYNGSWEDWSTFDNTTEYVIAWLKSLMKEK